MNNQSLPTVMNMWNSKSSACGTRDARVLFTGFWGIASLVWDMAGDRQTDTHRQTFETWLAMDRHTQTIWPHVCQPFQSLYDTENKKVRVWWKSNLFKTSALDNCLWMILCQTDSGKFIISLVKLPCFNWAVKQRCINFMSNWSSQAHTNLK